MGPSAPPTFAPPSRHLASSSLPRHSTPRPPRAVQHRKAVTLNGENAPGSNPVRASLGSLQRFDSGMHVMALPILSDMRTFHASFSSRLAELGHRVGAVKRRDAKTPNGEFGAFPRFSPRDTARPARRRRAKPAHLASPGGFAINGERWFDGNNWLHSTDSNCR